MQIPKNKKRMGCCIVALAGLLFLMIVGMVTSPSVERSLEVKPTKSETPVQTPKPANYDEVYKNVVSAAQAKDYDALKSALDTAKAENMTTIVAQAREAGYFKWMAENKPLTPLEKAKAALVDLEETNLLKGYDQAKRVYFINGPMWELFPVPQKELVVNIMRVVEANGNKTIVPSFEVRDFHSNELLASYSTFSGVKIGSGE